MLRNIRLYGTLEKLAGRKDFRFDCDTQQQLFAGLLAQCPKLAIPLRQMKTVHMAWAETEDQKEPKACEQGFRFSNRANYIHMCPSTEGAWPYVIVAIIAIVVSYAIVRLTMPHMSSNQSAGSRSTMFNGPVNSTEQGNPIPIIYGKCTLVGSQIIASDEDYYNMLGTQVVSTAEPDIGEIDYYGFIGEIR
jgi:predicted phage tail protein